MYLFLNQVSTCISISLCRCLLCVLGTLRRVSWLLYCCRWYHYEPSPFNFSIIKWHWKM